MKTDCRKKEVRKKEKSLVGTHGVRESVTGTKFPPPPDVHMEGGYNKKENHAKRLAPRDTQGLCKQRETYAEIRRNKLHCRARRGRNAQNSSKAHTLCIHSPSHTLLTTFYHYYIHLSLSLNSPRWLLHTSSRDRFGSFKLSPPLLSHFVCLNNSRDYSFSHGCATLTLSPPTLHSFGFHHTNRFFRLPTPPFHT